jgi:hypothetical protein
MMSKTILLAFPRSFLLIRLLSAVKNPHLFRDKSFQTGYANGFFSSLKTNCYSILYLFRDVSLSRAAVLEIMDTDVFFENMHGF